ncbi:hypothetical protein DLREEDagrD3_08240 [Denitratisoma sp. agr-D3]
MDSPSDDVIRALGLNGQPLSACLDIARAADLLAARPNLLADSRVFLAARWQALMADAIAAIERIAALPGWQQRVAAAVAPGRAEGRGVFFGYDFHITEQGPRLIEINTNAGGAFINARLLACQAGIDTAQAESVEQAFVAMFQREWQAAGKTTPLRRVAIVDEAPESQYLYPDFQLCRDLLLRSGIDTLICAPEQLALRDGVLYGQDQAVDLVYNRLTDFSLSQPGQAALRAAWRDGVAVVTPSPRHHALYADKHNLELLSDLAWLADIGATAADIAVIAAALPATERVHPEHEADLWARRKGLFFKPAGGYGGKAVYRGANVTKRVFADILAGDYVAQVLAPPPSRTVVVDNAPVELKYDLRCYAYEGKIQLMAARLWQGQTTNFRTPGGGFAPVVIV